MAMSNSKWPLAGSTGANVLACLQGGEKTRAQLLAAVGGSVQNLQAALQRLVAARRVARVRTGVYALAADPGHA